MTDPHPAARRATFAIAGRGVRMTGAHLTARWATFAHVSRGGVVV